MPTIPHKTSFSGGINLDLAYNKLPPDKLAFLKNITWKTNQNSNTGVGAGFNKEVGTPVEGNYNMPITLPAGDNLCVGGYSSEQTNEFYFFLWNSNLSHTIWVVEGDTQTIVKVFQDKLINASPLLPFSLDPTNFYSEGRVAVIRKSTTNPVDGTEAEFVFLIFTNNVGNIFVIEKNASMATNSYSTSHFTDSLTWYDPAELFLLTPPTPMRCMGLNTPVAYTPVAADANLQNLLVNQGWQFRVKFIDPFGRETEHGIISNTFITQSGGACISTANGLPRCVNLNFDAGNPQVAQIQVEFRQWVGNDTVGALQSGWLIYDIFNKYETSANPWYLRALNPAFTTTGSGITFNPANNKITYTFCADKNSIPIDPGETSRTEPLTPLESGSLGVVSKSLALANNLRGYNPLTTAMIDKVVFSVQAADKTNYCAPAPTRTITVFANIYSAYNDKSQMCRRSYDLFVFGLSDSGGGCSYSAGNLTSSIRLGQVFGDQNFPGFIGYLAGTPYKCISEQVDFDPTTGTSIFQGAPFDWTTVAGEPVFKNQIMQKFTFVDVPAGKYIFRIGSHKAKYTDADVQQTSTYVAGATPISNLLVSWGRRDGYASNPVKEIEIDCTGGDVNLNQPSDPMFVILDLADGNSSGAIDGYLYEEPGGAPVEMNPIAIYGGSFLGIGALDAHGSFFTDHNGFYFCSASLNPRVEIWSDLCDGNGFIKRITIYNGSHCIKHGDGTNSPSGHCWGDNGNWKNKIYLAENASFSYGANPNPYPNFARRRIREKITVCSTSNPLPGIPVIMTKGGYDISDNNGNIEIIAHNRYSYASFTSVYLYASVPNYSGSPNNQDKLIYSQKGGCQWNACSGCQPYVADATVTYLGCGATYSGCTALDGRISDSEVLLVAGGGYNIGDQFQVNGGTLHATGIVTEVDGSHRVLAFVITYPGTGYTISGQTTTNITGSGTGFDVNILSIDYPLRTLCLGGLSLRPSNQNVTGVQFGGKYKLAFWLTDIMGRHTAPMSRQGELAYLTMPNVNDAAYQVFLPPKIRFDISGGFVVPAGFKWMTILVSQNLSFTDFVSLAADWVQPVDNAGNTNYVNPTAIRIYYNSLNEYNKQNNFSTNCAWRFIAEGTTDAVQGDVCQFIMNGTGTWIPSVVSSPVTYDKSGAFFTIDWVPELANLTNNCLFRIIRPSSNTSGEFAALYEQCFTIPIIDNAPNISSGVIPYTDTYILGRLMPVPRMKDQPNPISPFSYPFTPVPIAYNSTGGNTTIIADGYVGNNVNNTNGAIIFEAIDDATSYPFPFESPSPSDLWGSHLASRGRVGVENPNYAQARSGTEICVSAAVGERPNSYNGMGYFESQNIQIFDRQTWGNIVAILVETSEILVICESDHFVIRYNTSQLRTDGSGNVVSQNPFGIFTAPERRSGENYGCIPLYINTIRRYNGLIFWLDAKGRLIKSNISQSVDICRTDESKGIPGGYEGFLQNKISSINYLSHNVSGTFIWLAGIDPKANEYVLTIWYRTTNSGSGYLNDSLALSLNDYSQTITIDIETGVLKDIPSFTPEYYGMIPGLQTSKNFLSFRKGQAWFHHAGVYAIPQPYANFYGTQCKCVILPVINNGSETVKRFLYVEIYTGQKISNGSGVLPDVLFYMDNIATDKGQLSRLLKQQWDIRDNFQCAAYLCDMSGPSDPNLVPMTTTHRILDGNPLQGRYMTPRIITNDRWMGTYFEVSGIINYVNMVMKSGQ